MSIGIWVLDVLLLLGKLCVVYGLLLEIDELRYLRCVIMGLLLVLNGSGLSISM